MNLSLPRGTHVTHLTFGSGVIQDEWGSWYSCRSCYIELKPNQLLCSDCAARAALSPDPDDSLMHPLQVSGKGTYDVLFSDGKIRAINMCWLTVKHGLVAA